MTKKIQFRAFIPPIMSAIRTGGDSMRLTFDVPESDLQDAVALIALRDTPLRITVEVDNSKTATKPEPIRGPHGQYWRYLVSHGIESHPDMLEILTHLGWLTEDNDVAMAMREAFNVTSRSFISPQSFERWCGHNKLHSVISLSRNASAAVEAKAS